MSTQVITDVLVKTKTRERIVKKYKVIYHNDDKTTMEFVIKSLMKHFNKSIAEAYALTLAVHVEGKGVAGIFNREIAEQKVSDVREEARAEGYPLRVTWEEA